MIEISVMQENLILKGTIEYTHTLSLLFREILRVNVEIVLLSFRTVGSFTKNLEIVSVLFEKRRSHLHSSVFRN